MQVLESLLKWLATHPCDKKGPRFSVNLMPLTLLQKNIARQILRLFKRYHISPQAVILEIARSRRFLTQKAACTTSPLHKFVRFAIPAGAIDKLGSNYNGMKVVCR
ncbi:hypothetical protein ACLK17_14760 [Escherichia coli]